VVTTPLALDGWPVELADTAGWRDETGPLEEMGLSRARERAASADLCLWILDAAAPPTWPTFACRSLQLVINKMDLPATWDLDQAQGALRVSARTGLGLAELCSGIASRLVPDPPRPGVAVPFTEDQFARLEKAQRAVEVEDFRAACDLLEGLRTAMKDDY
jgi:tRNA modification GTPase